ncbi:MAG: PhnD/SsuA/transferrin family substrate-binding protein [Propylenella sp.]
MTLASAAQAQPGDDLLRVLKPWIKRQLLGGEKPAAEAEPAESPEPETPTAAEPSAESAVDPATAATEATETPPTEATETPPAEAIPPAEATSEPAPEDAAAATPDAPAAEPDAGAGAAAAVEPDAADEPQDSPAGALATPAPPLLQEPIEPLAPPLRFAVLAGRSAAATMAAVGPVADDISAAIGRPVELLAVPSYAAMIDAQVERRIDGGFYSAAAFALAQSRCHCLEPIVAPRAFDGTLAYHAIIVARADAGIASAFDLQGKTVAVGAADSIGARRMQLAGLMASGIDPATAFAGVIEAESASQAVLMVRDRLADAAFAWSSLSGYAPAGYSRGTLTQMVTDGEIAMRDLVIVWRSAPVAHGPFAVLTTLGEDEKDRIGALFVGLDAARPASYDALNPFYSGGYAPVDADDYGGLETLTVQNVDALHLPKAVAEATPPGPPLSIPELLAVEPPAVEPLLRQ